MKRFAKLLSVVLALALVAGMFALTACGDKEPEHQHTYAESWSTSDSKHWHESTCEHKGLKNNEAAHDKKGADGSCSVCGYKPHVHTYAEEWSKDATNHWHAASCEHTTLMKDKAKHDANGEGGGCGVCGWKPEHQHVYNTNWSINSQKHWKIATCAHKDLKSEEAAHTPDADGRCTVCKYKPHEDVYEYQWYDEYHWLRLRCSDKANCNSCDKGLNENIPKSKNRAKHTLDENGVCTVCGFVKRNPLYNNDCADTACTVCGGCMKRECVHSSEETHKFCGGDHAKTLEIEAEDAYVYRTDGNASILDHSENSRGCVHAEYANVKFTITVSKACTVTLKIRSGSISEKFTDKGAIFVNDADEPLATNARFAQTRTVEDHKCSMAWTTIGCISLKEGVNTIDVCQKDGGYQYHLDKIAILCGEDVTITYDKIDNSAITVNKNSGPMPKTDEDFDIPAAELKNKKYQA